eukprot:3915111-Karenia_brevis.AAC.1
MFDAYSLNPSKPNYEWAKYFAGKSDWSDAAVPELRSYVARRARDDMEVEESNQKVRELKAPPNLPKAPKG